MIEVNAPIKLSKKQLSVLQHCEQAMDKDAAIELLTPWPTTTFQKLRRLGLIDYQHRVTDLGRQVLADYAKT